MKNFFSKNKKIIIPLFILVILALFLYPHISYADTGGSVAKVLGWIIYPFIWIFGKLAILFLDMLIGIAQYSNFIHSSAVTYGWIVVRDLCNMFFVLILLIIAFASILRIESYNLKTWLPKLVIMAVLINFSKLICGIFIDFTQVIMLTFINAIKDIAGGNLTEMLGITKILKASDSSAEVGFFSIIGSMILALVLVVIATVVILTVMVMLAMRIVMIWIYVVLSPLAYLLASFPQGQQYSQRWWADFSKNLIIGPVIAFFLWLSFASLGGLNSEKDINDMNKNTSFSESLASTEAGATSTSVSAAATEAGSKDNMTLFVISIGMLLGGMMIAQEMGGQAGKVVGKGMGKLQAMGAGSLKMGKRVTGVERAENAFKSYKQQKDSKRSELAQRDAGSMLKAEAKAKQGLAYVPQKVGQGIAYYPKQWSGVSNKQIKQKEEALRQKETGKKNLIEQGTQLRTDLDKSKGDKDTLLKVEGELQLISDLENEKNTKLADYNNRIAAAFAAGDPTLAGSLTTERDNTVADYDQRIQTKENEAVNSFNAVTGLNTTSSADVAANLPQAKINRDAEISFKEGDISANDTRIQALSDNIENDNKDLAQRRKKSEKIGKWGSVIGGALTMATGLALGGVAAPVGAGMVVTGAAAFGRKRIKHAGNDALDLASNYNGSQISKHKEKMKEEKEEDLRSTMNDYSKSSHERTAAAMTLMDRGELSKEEAKVKSEEISSTYKKDNRVLNQLDSSLKSNYQDLTRVFSDLKNSAPGSKEREDAESKIVNGVITGDIKMHNIDDQASIDLIVPKLAEKMTATNFKNMYNGQTNEKRDKIKKSLADSTRAGSIKAGDQLVNIQNKLNVLETGNPATDDKRKLDFLSNAGKDQIKGLTDNAEGLKSLADILKKNSQLEYLASVNNIEEFKKAINIITKKSQFNSSSGDTALIKQIIKQINS